MTPSYDSMRASTGLEQVVLMFYRYRLLPYIIEQCRTGAALGLPLVRAMVVEFPEDRNVWNLESQYMFGSDILVAPMLQPLEDSERQSIYIPAGTWYSFWDKTKLVSAGKWIDIAAAPLDSMHIWVKEGAVIPWTADRTRTYNKVGDVTKLEVYGGKGPWTVGDGQGNVINVEKGEGGKISVKGNTDIDAVYIE